MSDVLYIPSQFLDDEPLLCEIVDRCAFRALYLDALGSVFELEEQSARVLDVVKPFGAVVG